MRTEIWKCKVRFLIIRRSTQKRTSSSILMKSEFLSLRTFHDILLKATMPRMEAAGVHELFPYHCAR